MLTDIFADRYSNTKIWDEFGEAQRRLIVQIFRLLSEQICPYWLNGKESESGKMFWTDIHSRLSMELGLKSLSALAYAYSTTWGGKPQTATGTWTLNKVCENWMLKEFDGSVSADSFIKERISLVEIAFRKREEEIVTDFTRENFGGKKTEAKAIRHTGRCEGGAQCINQQGVSGPSMNLRVSSRLDGSPLSQSVDNWAPS